MFDTNIAAEPAVWSDALAQFPTVKANDQGGYDYWHVPIVPINQQAALELGQNLAEASLDLIRSHPETVCTLRRILRAIPNQCQVGEGFYSGLELALAFNEPQL